MVQETSNGPEIDRLTLTPGRSQNSLIPGEPDSTKIAEGSKRIGKVAGWIGAALFLYLSSSPSLFHEAHVLQSITFGTILLELIGAFGIGILSYSVVSAVISYVAIGFCFGPPSKLEKRAHHIERLGIVIQNILRLVVSAIPIIFVVIFDLPGKWGISHGISLLFVVGTIVFVNFWIAINIPELLETIQRSIDIVWFRRRKSKKQYQETLREIMVSLPFYQEEEALIDSRKELLLMLLEEFVQKILGSYMPSMIDNDRWETEKSGYAVATRRLREAIERYALAAPCVSRYLAEPKFLEAFALNLMTSKKHQSG